eukprot:6209699-Pleurochrysis_carterae.AAC.1
MSTCTTSSTSGADGGADGEGTGTIAVATAVTSTGSCRSTQQGTSRSFHYLPRPKKRRSCCHLTHHKCCELRADWKCSRRALSVRAWMRLSAQREGSTYGKRMRISYRDELVESYFEGGRGDNCKNFVRRHFATHEDIDKVREAARIAALQPPLLLFVFLQPAAAPATHCRDDNVPVGHAIRHSGGDIGKDTVHRQGLAGLQPAPVGGAGAVDIDLDDLFQRRRRRRRCKRRGNERLLRPHVLNSDGLLSSTQRH